MGPQTPDNSGTNGSTAEVPKRPFEAGTDPARPVDGWTVVEVFSRRWHWLLLSGLLLGGAGVLAGMKMWSTSYSATAQLIRLESEHLTEFFKPRSFTDQTFGSLLRTPELLARVGSQLSPPLSANEVGGLLQITPVPESEIVEVRAFGADPDAVIRLANLYATNAVSFTRELQKREAGEVNEALKLLLSEMDADVTKLNEQLRMAPNLPFQPNQQLADLYQRLQLARTDLTILRGKYTDIHPDVQRKLAEVAELEKQIQGVSSQNAAPGSRFELSPGQAHQADSQSHSNGTRKHQARVSTDAYDPGHEFLRNQLYAVQAARMTLAARQRDAQTFTDNPPGYCTVLTPATPQDVAISDPRNKIAFLGLLGAVVGMGAALALVLLVELLDDRLRTVEDVRRVTRLPVLAALGDLRKISPAAQANWAFRTWTALQSRLSLSPNHGLVCGITSSAPGEGRSTWVHLLGQAASQCGFKVLTIATLPSPDHNNGNGHHENHHEDHGHQHPGQERAEPGQEHSREDEIGPLHQTTYEPPPHTNSDGTTATTMALTTSVLARPGEVTQQLTAAPHPLVHIPLPGWVWNLERRKQWQSALTQWSHIDNVVILVELPPASSSEAVLLAENLPNLIWLADSGRSSAADCREQLQTLRNARCHLVGSVLNHEPKPPLKRRFSRWIGCWLTLGCVAGATWPAQAQVRPPAQPRPSTILPTQPSRLPPQQQPLAPVVTPGIPAPVAPEPVAARPVVAATVAAEPALADNLAAAAGDAEEFSRPRTNVSFSVLSPGQRAPWQERLTLGPGDVLNFGLFGEPELSRTEVVVRPDGRVGYLNADVMAAGLTIDELRASVDEALGKFYRSPRTIITPVAWRSKKYYVLGKVVNKGVYTLERPITLLEAVARANGLETGLLDQNSVDLADLQRSFLVRGGQRAQVNFEKLFYDGDLSQNVPIEPNDYLYFAAGNLREVYVVGEVNNPGPVLFTRNTTVVGAIASRNGFTDRAYKSRVLVVRGSLQHPLTFVVDVWKTLEARGLDFQLQPKDIIYVSYRPFIRGEELLDLAITGFIQSAAAAWTGEHIGPIITSPIIK